jgi:hypothetical protein
VNTLEDRLREAFRADAETVKPEAIRDFPGTAARRGGPWVRAGPGRKRLTISLTAAAAVAAITVTASVVAHGTLPGHQRDRQVASHHGTSAAQGADVRYPRFLVALDGSNGPLAVRNATIGALVARVSPPGHGLFFGAVATGNGQTFVAALWRAGICSTWFYQFRLNRAGQPTALTPYAVPEVTRQIVSNIAVSGDGHVLAYLTQPCTRTRPSAHLTVRNIAAGTTRQWAIPGQADVFSLSLTADGRLLAYNIELTKLFASVARVLPTDAAPGTAAQRSRTVARAAAFGPSTDISADVITADGSALYFTTNATGAVLSREHPFAWQLRMADLATGRSRVQASYPGLPFGLSADPAGRFLLIQSQLGRGISTPRLARLDTATGKVTRLPAAWLGPDHGAVIAW